MRIAVFAAIGLVVMTSALHAQSDDDDDDDEAEFTPLVPTGNSMRFGLRYVGGPKVTFHDVGAVPPTVSNPPALAIGVRNYNDGYVSPDSAPDTTGHPRNDGMTNTWKVDFPTQVTTGASGPAGYGATGTVVSQTYPGNVAAGNIAYHIYSSTSAADEHNINARNSLAEGWELDMGRHIGKIGRNVDVSLVAGFTFSSINSKRNSDLTSDLTTISYIYPLSGQAPPTVFPYEEPTSTPQTVYDSNGQPKTNPNGSTPTNSSDTSLRLSQQPTGTITTEATATVRGKWQIKGAYYSLRLGPLFEIPVTERLRLTLRAGVAGIFVGTTYTADEVLLVDNVTAPLADVETKTHSMLLPAWYADAGAEYWLTERTGFYLDAAYQRSQAYNQELIDRSATIDMSSSSGITSGLTLRF